MSIITKNIRDLIPKAITLYLIKALKKYVGIGLQMKLIGYSDERWVSFTKQMWN